MVDLAGAIVSSGPRFRLALLGAWRLTADGRSLALRSRERRVTALLALRSFDTRARLAATLWPDSTGQQSLGSLRAAVFNLRREAPGLLAEGSAVPVLSDKVATDVGELVRRAQRAWSGEGHHWSEETITGLDVPDLLVGWYEDWIDEERKALRRLRLQTLTTIAETSLQGGRPDLAQAAAAAATIVDPTSEACCELLLRAHLELGESVDAVQEFESFRRRLTHELGVQPSRHLRRLAYAGVGASPTPNGRAHGLSRRERG